MAPPATARPDARGALRWSRRLVVFAAVLLALHLDLNHWHAVVGWWSDRADAQQPLRSVGAPVRVAGATPGRVYLLTVQEQVRRRHRLNIQTLPTGHQLHLDLWAFDATDARPLWRRRVLAGPRSALAGHRLLGAEGGRLWLYANGLRGLALDDGAPLAGPGDLERHTPAVRGLLPVDPGRYGFDAAGVHLVDDSATAWRLDGASLQLHAPDAGPAPGSAGIVAPAWYQAHYSDAFKVRGLDLDQRWLGLLDSDEARRLAAPPQRPGSAAGERPGAMAHHLSGLHTPNLIGALAANRYRLWGAQIVQVSAAPPGWPASLPDNWGRHDQYRQFAVLPQAPEFLDAGLLAAAPEQGPMLLRKPDSVLVLHRDRLGAGGRLQLARVAGPEGEVRWNSALPLTVLQAVLPGAGSLVLFGQAEGAGTADAVSVLVAIDLAGGRVASYALDGEGAAFTAIGGEATAL